jgi:two-component system KDP operon response regulator KdpE
MDEKAIRVLVADDERPIRRFLNASLSGQYTVLEAATGAEALAVTVTGRPDVIILDLGLPDIDGVEVTRRLREWTQIPIIVVSVRDREEDKIAALDAGADDYLTKPFGAGELMARLRVALRRSAQPDSEPVYLADGLMVDLSRREVLVNGQSITLTPT